MDKAKVTKSLLQDLEFCQQFFDLFDEFLGLGPLISIEKNIDQIVPAALQQRAKEIMDQRRKEHRDLGALKKTPEGHEMHDLMHSYLAMVAKFVERADDIRDPESWCKNFRALYHRLQKAIIAMDQQHGTGTITFAA